MIIYLLLLGACVFDASAIIEPSYYYSRENINKAMLILYQEILSMDGDIPYLKDSRRHYAEIVHVLYKEAKGTTERCFPKYYDIDYSRIVNVAAPEAIINPQVVINGTKRFIEEFNQKTANIRALISEICTGNKSSCDPVIRNIVDKIDFFKKESDTYLSGGYAAFEFVQRASQFSRVSKEYNAHRYVIQGKENLRNPSLNLFNLLESLGKVSCVDKSQ